MTSAFIGVVLTNDEASELYQVMKSWLVAEGAVMEWSSPRDYEWVSGPFRIESLSWTVGGGYKVFVKGKPVSFLWANSLNAAKENCGKYIRGETNYERGNAEDSCGCAWCDLGLEPEPEFLTGALVHWTIKNGIVPCTKE